MEGQVPYKCYKDHKTSLKIVKNLFVKLNKATISWSVGLCVAGGAVLRYEIQLKNKIDSELNNNDENTVGTIERPNQDKQGNLFSTYMTVYDRLYGVQYYARVHKLWTINSSF